MVPSTRKVGVFPENFVKILPPDDVSKDCPTLIILIANHHYIINLFDNANVLFVSTINCYNYTKNKNCDKKKGIIIMEN